MFKIQIKTEDKLKKITAIDEYDLGQKLKVELEKGVKLDQIKIFGENDEA